MCVAANTATTIDGTKKTVENSVIKRRRKKNKKQTNKKQTISGTVTLKTQIPPTVTSSLTASKYLSWAGQWEKKLSQIYSSDYHRRKASTSWNWKSIVEQQETRTLPVRTTGQMYRDKYKDVIQRAHNVRLTAYNGHAWEVSPSASKSKKATYLPNSTWLTYLDQQ